VSAEGNRQKRRAADVPLNRAAKRRPSEKRTVSHHPEKGSPMQQRRWQLLTSVILSLIILVLAFINREQLIEALRLAQTANWSWLALAFGIILTSYLISSQVFRVVLRSLGYQLSIIRLWVTALVAIVISQSIPAGGVGSYAFLVRLFKRQNIPAGQSTLLASLEMLSYAIAMLLLLIFSLFYLASRHLIGRFGWARLAELLLAALVALLVIGGAIFVLTRRRAVLARWLLAMQNVVSKIFRRTWDKTWIRRVVNDLSEGRALLASRRGDMVLLVLIQLMALAGHSLAMLVILLGFGTTVHIAVVLTAFGVALITSTFNVLPGGGGTVEFVLIAVLTLLGVGPAAVPAAIIFRLMNFWLLTPIAAGGYSWLMHSQPAHKPGKTSTPAGS
jgi:uncharacterized protein (TIRG00374 family)